VGALTITGLGQRNPAGQLRRDCLANPIQCHVRPGLKLHRLWHTGFLSPRPVLGLFQSKGGYNPYATRKLAYQVATAT
jgi:hypothetical protein